MMILGYTKMEIAVGVMILSLAFIVFLIAYKKLLAYLRIGTISKEKYCVLYSLEVEPANGIVQFYFESEEKREVKLQLLDQDYNFIKYLFDKECKVGGNIIKYDTRELANGTYFYSLLTENQKTMKKMTVQN